MRTLILSLFLMAPMYSADVSGMSCVISNNYKGIEYNRSNSGDGPFSLSIKYGVGLNKIDQMNGVDLKINAGLGNLPSDSGFELWAGGGSVDLVLAEHPTLGLRGGIRGGLLLGIRNFHTGFYVEALGGKTSEVKIYISSGFHW